MLKLKTLGIALGYIVLSGWHTSQCYAQEGKYSQSAQSIDSTGSRASPGATNEVAPENSSTKEQSFLPSYMQPPPPKFKYLKTPAYPGIKLLPAMRSAISKFDSDFKIWNSTEYPSELYVYRGFTFSSSSDVALSVGIGDFNGDGHTDSVIAGHDAEFEMVLVLVSSRTANGISYDVMPICVTNDDLYWKKYHSSMHAYCGGITNGSSTKDFIGKPQIFIRRIIKRGTCLTHDECEGDCSNYCLKADAFETFGINYPVNNSDLQKGPGLGPRDLFRWDFEPSKYDPYDFVRYGIY